MHPQPGTSLLQTVSPVDGRIYVERPWSTAPEVEAALTRAATAQPAWRRVPIAERARVCRDFVAAFEAQGTAMAEEITWQMGRPIAASPGEIRGTLERARGMIELAPEALRDIEPAQTSGFERYIRREPLGIVLTIAAWNYPFLIAINSVLPAIMAGNAVILKHSAQTPLAAERLAECFRMAGLPRGVLEVLHLPHEDTARLIGDPRIAFVAFTGSVSGGAAVQRAAAERFIGIGLELGGNDPAYVREDADLEHALAELIDGAFFNSGQSCCGIGRIYVHRSLYRRFVDALVERTYRYRLGDPRDPEVTLGPLVRTAAADSVRAAIERARREGARALIDESRFEASRAGTPYLAPQVLVDVRHDMEIMREETFGPVVSIMPVADDAQAVSLMNDSRYGLTASVWTRDARVAASLGERVETGTWFMNRCDYLDPALAWVGVKDSGRGCTLSVVGFEHLTRPKSFHLRVRT